MAERVSAKSERGIGDGGLYLAAIGSPLLVASWNFITLAGRRLSG